MRLTFMRWSAAFFLAPLILLAGCSGDRNVSPPPSLSASVSETSSPAATCDSAPDVEFTAPGQARQALVYGTTITVAAKVGQPVGVTFVGACAVGGRLSVNGTNAAYANSYKQVWSGQVTGHWTPTRPGTRTLLVAWACMGPMLCPETFLGYIKVTTPET